MTVFEASVHIAARLAPAAYDGWLASLKGPATKTDSEQLLRLMRVTADRGHFIATELAKLAVADDQQQEKK